MSLESLRLPNTYIDARDMIKDALESAGKLSIRRYMALFSSLCDVTHFHIEEIHDEEAYANLDLVLTYKQPQLEAKDNYSFVEKTKNLRVLCNHGDNLWNYQLINKVWDGDYPSTVAVDVETKEVFLFSVKLNRIELIEFGELTNSEFETFCNELHERDPFRVLISPEAMYDYLSESEGINHLKRNIYVEFNCGLPLRVFNSRTAVF